MTPGSIPLVIVALVMLSLEGTPIDRVDLLASGSHEIDRVEAAIVAVDAEVVIRADLDVPLYVVGGVVRLEGNASRVTQLGGLLTVPPGSGIAHLRAYGGDLEAAAGSVGVMSTLESNSPSPGSPLPALAVGSLLFGTLSITILRRHRPNVENLGHAVRQHPVVAISVGTLVFLGGMSLLTFMLFTIVLFPLALLGGLIGLVLVTLGAVGWVGLVIGWVGPLAEKRGRMVEWVAALGTIPAFSLLGLIPVLGDVLVGVALLVGLGASVITLMGFRHFRPPSLPDSWS